MDNKLPLIYWFEDEPTVFDSLLSEVAPLLKKSAEIRCYDLNDKKWKDRKGTYRSHIYNEIEADIDNIQLIICDQDLSKSEVMRGLSGDPIEAIAHSEGIPLVVYSKGMGDKVVDRMLQNRSFAERRFVLDLRDGSDQREWPRKVYNYFDGTRRVFEFIRRDVFPSKNGKMIPQKGTPAQWMSRLLEGEDAQTRLSLYATGDQQYLETLASSSSGSDMGRQARVLAAEMSYWLWDSILRFPGVIVNEIAAASLLQIDPKDFALERIQKHFNYARYTGPFSLDAKFWWRDALEARVLESGLESGYEFLKKKRIKVSKCRCSVDKVSEAGYYCMLTCLPVSYKNSKGGIPYFPTGADLARVSIPELRRISPWAGVSL